jgi:Flp pilus assembly protein CpaB
LVLLIGVFLAVVAFIAIIVLRPGSGTDTSNQPPATQATVVASVDIPLGVKITADMVKEVQLPPEGRPAGLPHADPNLARNLAPRTASCRFLPEGPSPLV